MNLDKEHGILAVELSSYTMLNIWNGFYGHERNPPPLMEACSSILKDARKTIGMIDIQ
jgi:hypothetical protein